MSDHATQRDLVARVVVDAAYVVHTTLGPGLLESAYEECLAVELASRGLLVARQTPVAVVYRGGRIAAGFRMEPGGVPWIDMTFYRLEIDCRRMED